MPEIARTDIGHVESQATAGASGAARLTRAQKAAVVLCLLGRDAARTVFETLDEAALERFAAAMAGLGHIDEETVGEVVAEFLGEIDPDEGSVRGGLEKARSLLGEQFDADVVERIFRELEKGAATGRGGDLWARLSRVDARLLAEILAEEHPQSAAVVLARLPADHAGEVANRMSAETVSKIVLSIRNARNVDDRYADLIGDNLSRSLAQGRARGRRRRTSRQVAAIMDNTRGELRDAVLGLVEQEDADFAEATRRSLFTFVNLPSRLRARDVPVLVRSLDIRVLLVALAAGDEATQAAKAFVLSNISTRFAEQIGQEIKDLRGVETPEVERAQREVMKVLVELDSSGEIALVRDAEDD